MNYYSHHIGDFDRATRHLTRLERSIYRDLIDVYYDTEQYLTLDLVALCRKVIALSNEEATTVERMLNEFFVHTPDGWMHHRCQEEIGKYHAKAEQASRAGKASAAKRTFNGRSTDVQPTNNQEPITNNQKPKKEAKASSVASFDAPDWFPASQWSDFIKMRKAMKSVPFTEAACKGVIREVEKLCKQGHDAANLLETAVMNGWRTVYPPKVNGHAPSQTGETAWQKSQRERVAQFAPGVAKRAPTHETLTILEDINVAPSNRSLV